MRRSSSARDVQSYIGISNLLMTAYSLICRYLCSAGPATALPQAPPQARADQLASKQKLKLLLVPRLLPPPAMLKPCQWLLPVGLSWLGRT
jgi:hypothetical protein